MGDCWFILEDYYLDYFDILLLYGNESFWWLFGVFSFIYVIGGWRVGIVRVNKISNYLFYMLMDDKIFWLVVVCGDEEMVMCIF